MLGKLLPFERRDPNEPSLWQDLRAGRAGFWPRLGLSLGAAMAAAALAVLTLGVWEVYWRVDDEHAMMALGAAAAVWSITMFYIWGSYRRFRRAVRTAFTVLTVWAVAIPAMALVVNLVWRGEEFFVAGIIFLAGAATLSIISSGAYRGTGKPMRNSRDEVDVRCPDCGYSLVGLSESACPECGKRFTIDELFEAQAYSKPHLPGASHATSAPLKQLPAEVEPPAGGAPQPV